MSLQSRTALTGTVALFLLAQGSSLADEGMWTLDNFPAARIADRYGTQVDEAFLERLQLATTRIEGGCSGSFASPDGLILTNHHCIQSCLTELSSADDDKRANGFLAAGRDDEQRCASEQVSVLVGYSDVTDRVAAAIAGLDEEEANKVRKSTLTDLENECTATSGDDVTACESVTLYHGGQYFLYRYKRYDDIRLVFAPEQSIAAFGGDPDNFNFPRWCLDMALLRAYENGEPARTLNHLDWKRSGAAAGETVFVSGHPGSTQRLDTVAELTMAREIVLPEWVERNAEQRGRIIQYGKSGAEARRVADEVLQIIENGLKVQRNRLRALLNEEMFSLKRAQEAELRDAIAASATLSERYGGAFDDIDDAMQTYRDLYLRYNYLENSAAFAGVLYNYARHLVRAAQERERPESERLRAYTDSALEKLRPRILAPRPVHADLERVRLSFSLDKLREAFGHDDPVVKLVLGRRSPDTMAADLIARTTLADPAVREALWDGGIAAVEASEDPLIRLALAVDPEARRLRKRYDDDVEAPLTRAGEQLAAARFSVYGTSNYPDATFTFRITYGTVAGWEEQGESVEPFTSVASLYPRVTGEPPFDLPPSWQPQTLDDSVRFNFVATTDIVGGNSGSPATNAAGQLVGLAFDGNRHSIAGSYFFDETLNRTVLVHPEVMLAALETIYGADALVDEITVD